MAYAMTKQGSLDNAIVYEFVCDTIADMNTIQNKYRTIGSIAVVLKGESEGLEVYIAGSDKQWNSLSSSSGSDSLTGGGLTIYICAQNEVSNGVPNISEPDESTVYLVANNGDTGNLYDEYIYVNNAWEKWGSAGIDVSGFAPKASPVFTGSISLGRKANTTVGENSVAEGSSVTASGNNSHAEGAGTTASGYQSHAEGVGVQATGNGSHAEGGGTHATGQQSHTEGGGTTASGENSHAEGSGTMATGQAAHAEGGGTQAAASNAHVEGSGSQATANQAHAEGGGTKAFGENSHAEGGSTEASGINSHAEGLFTTAIGANEHVSGRYNKVDTADTWTANTSYTVGALVKREESYADAGNTIRNITTIYKCKTANSDSTFNSSKWEESGEYLFVVGNGSSNNSRSNAFSVGWTGNVAEGGGTTASGNCAHAEGGGSIASGNNSHAEGGGTTASGQGSHAEGLGAEASGMGSHAEGASTTASSNQSHAEGASTTASGGQAHAEGAEATASGNFSHAEGGYTKASGTASHAEGYGGTYTSNNTTYESKAAGVADHIEGFQCLTADSQPGNHAEGYQTRATGGSAHAEGNVTLASGSGSHSEGTSTTASGAQSHAEGAGTTASGAQSHAEGSGTTASSGQSHAEGSSTTASGQASHAEGGGTNASGVDAHAEGGGTAASGVYAHSEGNGTKASASSAHAEGSGSIAAFVSTHAEGANTAAYGAQAHAEGSGTIAYSNCSHAEGLYTTAVGFCEHVSGQYNVLDTADTWVGNTSYTVGQLVRREESYVDSSNITRGVIRIYKCKTANSDSSFTSSKWEQWGKYLVVVGNGTSSVYSNAYALDWSGNEYLAGDLYVGCAADSTGGVKLARIPAPSTATDGTYNLQATVSSGTITYSWVAAPASANGVSF